MSDPAHSGHNWSTWVMCQEGDGLASFCPVDEDGNIIVGLTLLTSLDAMKQRADCDCIVQVDNVYEPIEETIVYERNA